VCAGSHSPVHSASSGTATPRASSTAVSSVHPGPQWRWRASVPPLAGAESAHPTKTGRLIAGAIADEAAMSDAETVVPSASLPEKNSAAHSAAQALRLYALDRMD
jgi:hypothetical protein